MKKYDLYVFLGLGMVWYLCVVLSFLAWFLVKADSSVLVHIPGKFLAPESENSVVQDTDSDSDVRE